MLSKARIKFVKSLQIKKYRKQEQLFTVEGAKSVLELLRSDFVIATVFGTREFLSSAHISQGVEIAEASPGELEAMGTFQSNDGAIAVASIKPNHSLAVDPNEFALALDDIRDPGNLGTIIRIADWYGIRKIVASEETADVYNAKVITATMGSFTRVSLYYTDLTDYLQENQCRVFGAYLTGQDVHHIVPQQGGLILIGNESKGISTTLFFRINFPWSYRR